ncbi:MAG: hypothetical protein O8C56_07810 [Candidatus Methanoperedens sp.]|nr:hypothetical protein [Candidatus Methanoperedens sp.]
MKNNEPQLNADERRLNIWDFCSEHTASAKNAKGSNKWILMSGARCRRGVNNKGIDIKNTFTSLGNTIYYTILYSMRLIFEKMNRTKKKSWDQNEYYKNRMD